MNTNSNPTRLYLAPLEGLTDCSFRQLSAHFFGAADAYYTPFLSPTQDHKFMAKEIREILPENNRGLHVIPQLLTHNEEDFLWAVSELQKKGYDEVNLNLGCPSGTVVRKRKGSGMLADLPLLERFLETVFEKCPLKISIKTRVGLHDSEDFPAILELFEQFPVTELIIHPRTQAQLYRGEPLLELWDYARSHCHIPLCYNGNVFDRQTYEAFITRFPDTRAVMIGRGLIADPALIREIRGGKTLSVEELHRFHEALLEKTLERAMGGRQTLLHMKEYWDYLSCCWEQDEKVKKSIKKTQTLDEYRMVCERIFREGILRDCAGFRAH